MDKIYENIEEYNPNKECKILIVFDDMIVDILSNKKLNPVATEIFIRERKLNISLDTLITYYIKFYTPFSQENSRPTRASANCI